MMARERTKKKRTMRKRTTRERTMIVCGHGKDGRVEDEGQDVGDHQDEEEKTRNPTQSQGAGTAKGQRRVK
jgi:hypothetical protein